MAPGGVAEPSRERGPGRDRGPARHELPELDAAALEAARAADRLLLAALSVRSRALDRYVTPLPDRLRDDPIPSLRLAGPPARAGLRTEWRFRDSLPPDVTEPFLEAIDRLLKAIARHDAHRD